ncbi:MAG: hybrid sensor histidine kinase/response regulator [Arcobacteraceae bacterium]|jgi:DNA-binding response OmpR family regulator/anti-sigma regulatory factor (Ser/Thr protein kinase)|nr:hybrid sensor histidine kinase/response regulator [Arcobacteraceae bacterium]
MKRTQTILIVDDTKANVDILLNLLDNYDLIVALDGQTALDILYEENNEIDLILLDIMMPLMDGFEVCKRVKENPKIADIPIIFITAKTDDESIEKGFYLGGVDYVQKPFRAIELLARVKTQLAIKENEKRLVQYNKFEAIAGLVDNMAHQWRQPLSAISVSASGMLMQKEMGILTDESFYSLSNSIMENTEYLSSIIEQLKQIIAQNMEHQFFEPYKVIEENQAKIFENTHNIECIITVDEKLKMKGSKEKFLIVLQNIIQNSIDAVMDNDIKDGVIFLTISQTNEHILINIKDNGGGIKKEILENIFEPYFTTKHKSLGKGLGLYTVYYLIKESFGGSIKIYNDEFEYKNQKSKGVNCEIILPIS